MANDMSELNWQTTIPNLTITEKTGYWLAKYTGPFSGASMIDLGMKLVELLKAHPTRGIVLNVQSAQGELPMIARYQLVSAMTPYWPKATAMALVIHQSQFLKLTGFIFQKLATGAGFAVSVHFDEIKARQWMIEQLHLTERDSRPNDRRAE